MKKIRKLLWLLLAALVLSACGGMGSGPKLTITTLVVAQVGDVEFELTTLDSEEISVSKVENEDTGSSSWNADLAKLEKALSDAETEVAAMNGRYDAVNGISHPEVVLESSELDELIAAKGVIKKGKYEGSEITIVYRVEGGDDLKFNSLVGDRISFTINIADGGLVGDFSQPTASFVSFLQGDRLPEAKIRVDMRSDFYDPSLRVIESGHLGTLTVLNTNNGPVCDIANALLSFISAQNGGNIVQKVWTNGSSMTISMWEDRNPPTPTPYPSPTPWPTATPVLSVP